VIMLDSERLQIQLPRRNHIAENTCAVPWRAARLWD
jgi:hypothetical protein